MGKVYTQAQNKATQKYQKEKLEIVSFRVRKGKRNAYNELANKRNISLANMLETYLDGECEKENIPIVLEQDQQ